MDICYYCKKLINTSNSSIEHIIPNSIGGRLKSDRLICKNCNSIFGFKIDSELSRTFHSYMLINNLKKERGQVQSLLATDQNGNKILVSENKYVSVNPKIEMSLKNNTVQGIRVTHYDKKRCENELRRFSKMIPVIKTFKNKSVFPAKLPPVIPTFHIHANLNLLSLSLAKIALNYYFYKNGTLEDVSKTIDYVKNEGKNLYVYNYGNNIFKKDLANNEEIIHLIYLQGNKENKKLICFIQLFSKTSSLILLNNNYQGKDINYIYEHNLITENEIELEKVLPLNLKYIDNRFLLTN